MFLKAKQKNTVNYSIFGGLIATNAGIYTVFGMSRKRRRNETLYTAVEFGWEILAESMGIYIIYIYILYIYGEYLHGEYLRHQTWLAGRSRTSH